MGDLESENGANAAFSFSMWTRSVTWRMFPLEFSHSFIILNFIIIYIYKNKEKDKSFTMKGCREGEKEKKKHEIMGKKTSVCLAAFENTNE